LSKTTIKAVLFDGDGVLITPPALFSEHYALTIGVDPKSFLPFFKGVFRDALEGKADLKELITANPDIWHWEGDPTPLLTQWFDYENHKDEELLQLVEDLRSKDVLVGLASDQEQYRMEYLREKMFKGTFDFMFAACEIGYRKIDPIYFDTVLNVLSAGGVSDPSEVIYFDDAQNNIDTASSVGIHAYLYSDVAQVQALLRPALA
jgi:HAD superfamily hydrolase (TIGR01509 family)